MTESTRGSVLNGFVILITLFLFQPSLATARQIDVIVNLYVNEAGGTTDVFEDERAVTALVSAVDWQALASGAQLGPLDSMSLFVKGRQITLEPDSHDSDNARRLMRAVGLADGYDYGLGADRSDEEGFETRQIIAGMMERYLASIGLRRNGSGNPVNEVEIVIREASMRADLVVTIDLAEYDEAQNELVLLATVSNPGRDLAPSTITAAIDAQTGRVLVTEQLSSLSSDKSNESRITLPVPDDWRGTSRQIEVHVDFENAIPEVNEGNNVALSDPILINDLLGSDLPVIEPALPPQQSPWWFKLVIAVVVVSLAAGITVVIQKFRGGRWSGPEAESSSTPDAPDLTTRVQADPGQQRFGSETPGISLPGLHIRPILDEGSQKIGFTQAKPEEE